MPIIVPIVAEKSWLSYLLTGQSYRMKLYVNNYTPVSGSLLASFVEATFGGYAPAVLAAGDWVAPFDDGTGRAMSYNLLKNWARIAGGTNDNVYGYFVTDAGGTILYWAERLLGAPVDMTVVGNTMSILPVFTDRSEY